MPEYLSPGVYVEEIDAGAKPIEGVSTSTCGAIGITARGPTTGKPLLVTSFLDFERKFGGYTSEPLPALRSQWANDAAEGGQWWQFPLSVKGFFDNGGQRLYVKRVFSSTAVTAQLLLARGVIAEIIRDAPAGSTLLRLRHTIGIENGTAVNVFVDGVSVGAFAVSSYTAAGVVQLNNPVAQELVSGRDFVQIVARVATPAPPPDFRLTVRAKASGDWGGNEVADNGITAGNGVRARVRPVVSAALRMLASPTVGGNPASTAVAVDAAAGANAIQVASGAGFAVNDRVLIDGGEYTITGRTRPGQFTIAPAAAAAIPATTPITEGGNPRGAVVANAPLNLVRSTDVSNLANGDIVDILATAYTVSNLAPDNWVFTLNNPVPAGDTWTAGTTVRRMRSVIDPANANIINVQNASQLYTGAIVELDTGIAKEEFTVDSVAGDAVTLSGNPAANTYFEDYRVRLIEGEVSAQYRRNHIVVDEETFSNLRFVDDGGPNYIVRHVNTESNLIDLVAGADFAGSVSQIAELPIIPAPVVGPVRFWGDLAGGRDNLNGLSVDDFVGVEGGSEGSTGIQSLEYIDEVSICLAPGMWSSTIRSGLIIHCETLKDRFAILDPPDNLDIEGIREFREPIDTKYAGLYYPWVEVRDPLLRRNVPVAPSGHMAGLYARVDVERGVHKAPANEVIRGIRRIIRDVSKREQDLLNPKNINALRAFPGRGPRVWGARVLTSDASWKYINVRRLFIYVEESIDEGTQWVVFEPNDEPLWARVRATITNFLLTVWRSGALEGSKPEEAFFVKCDLTTMTQADIDNGRLICIIGIAPVKPAEFVIFRIQQKTREATGV
jgi:hypothetical protein